MSFFSSESFSWFLPSYRFCFILQRLRSDADAGNVFYLSDEQEPIEVAMMRSRGDFQTGFSEALQAKIIELPYEVGGRVGGPVCVSATHAPETLLFNPILIVLAERALRNARRHASGAR